MQEGLEFRRACLGAQSVEHLCKSIIMVNTRAPAAITDCSNPLHSKYYLIIVQARLALEETPYQAPQIQLNLGFIDLTRAFTGFYNNSRGVT